MFRLRPTAALLLAGALLRADQQAPPFLDRVEVSRVVIDARIVDGRGRAVRGLRPEHFRVEVDGRPIALASVDWIGGDEERDHFSSPAAPTVVLPDEDGAPDGRLVVFLFQKSLHASRMPGLLKMRTRLAELVDDLGPADRAAVLVFDSLLRAGSTPGPTRRPPPRSTGSRTRSPATTSSRSRSRRSAPDRTA